MLFPFTKKKKGETDTEIRPLLYFIKQSSVSPLLYIHSAMMNLKLLFLSTKSLLSGYYP
jgi:hypothetical protein